MRGNCTPVIQQCIEYLPVTAPTDAWAHQHHQIAAAEQLSVYAKTLAYQALDTVSFNCVAGCPDRYSGTEARVAEVGVDGQYRHQAVTGF